MHVCLYVGTCSVQDWISETKNLKNVAILLWRRFVQVLPPEFDVLCTHPMFGPKSGKATWAGLPFVYDKVRIGDGARQDRCSKFLDIFATEVESYPNPFRRCCSNYPNVSMIIPSPFQHWLYYCGGVAVNSRRLTSVSVYILFMRDHQGCRMVEIPCQEHDRFAAGSQFITHTVGR